MAAGVWHDAARHRAELDGVTFVAVTGSCGKSTTAHLAAAIVEPQLTGITSHTASNCGEPLAANLLRVRPTDDFCLQELGAWGPGTLDGGLDLLSPSIGVVLNVRRDHFSAFRGLANTQAEKAKVVASLPPSGTAILNADDELVRGMASATAARTLFFGRSSAADLQASDVSGEWPERLSFRLTYAGASHVVRTRLVGETGLGSALAAIAIAVALGVEVRAAIRRLQRVEPLARRMSVVPLRDGVTFVRDDFKAASDSIDDVLRFMAAARARRKVAVIGRISDHPGRSRPVYTNCARAAIDVVDELAFVGERPHSLWSAGPTPWDDPEAPSRRACVRVFRTVEDASKALNPELRAGDLVLLKASGPADHLERILHDRTGAVACWLSDCGRVNACDECERLRSAVDRPAIANQA